MPVGVVLMKGTGFLMSTAELASSPLPCPLASVEKRFGAQGAKLINDFGHVTWI